MGKTKVRKNDILILYGRIQLLESLEKRIEGNTGDEEHRNAVNEQKEIKQNQDDESQS